MANFVINVIGIFILAWIIYFIYLRLHPKAFDNALKKQAEKARNAIRKKDTDLLGKRMVIKRDEADPVHVNFYQPYTGEKQAAVFVCHGGTFMDGDADQLDSWCERMSRDWQKTIISINYTTIDQKQIPYPQEEIRDTLLYFARNAETYRLDPGKFVLLGFSAGAYLEVGAASLAKEQGLNIKGIIMFQPFIDDTLVRLADAHLHISPVSLIIAGTPQGDHVQIYSEHLEKAGVDLMVKTYRDAVPGFVEYNNPEYENNKYYAKSGAFTEEQKDMARACEMWTGNQIDAYVEEP